MIPLPEYPRPALRRDSYENLNGLWRYAVTRTAARPAAWDGEILVPYAPEAPASGVGRTLRPGEWLHYERRFALSAGEGGRVLLHFGAVDYACTVAVNGRYAGGHRGGYWPFTLDITRLVRCGGQDVLWVAVQDPTGCGTQARGKQTLTPGGMYYTAQSGIWQTVWLERVPDNYIQSLVCTPDYDAGTVRVAVRAAQAAAGLHVQVYADGALVAEGRAEAGGPEAALTLALPPDKRFGWSPEHPFLYDVTAALPGGDRVRSYFALRKWSCAADARGVRRVCLNGRPLLLNGLLGT